MITIKPVAWNLKFRMPLNQWRQAQDTTVILSFFREKANLDWKLHRKKKKENVNKYLSKVFSQIFSELQVRKQNLLIQVMS